MKPKRSLSNQKGSNTVSLQQSLRKSKAADRENVNMSKEKSKKNVKFSGKDSGKDSMSKKNKVRFRTDDAHDDRQYDNLYDKYIKTSLHDEVASINSINKSKKSRKSTLAFDIKSYGKLSDKMTPRLGLHGHGAKWIDPRTAGRVLKSREK